MSAGQTGLIRLTLRPPARTSGHAGNGGQGGAAGNGGSALGGAFYTTVTPAGDSGNTYSSDSVTAGACGVDSGVDNCAQGLACPGAGGGPGGSGPGGVGGQGGLDGTGITQAPNGMAGTPGFSGPAGSAGAAGASGAPGSAQFPDHN